MLPLGVGCKLLFGGFGRISTLELGADARAMRDVLQQILKLGSKAQGLGFRV